MPAQPSALGARAPKRPVNPVPPLTFPEALPVVARREEIARAIEANQVVIVSGETGSGKTTQLPKICLALGRGVGAGGRGLIGHTQPRRLAASSTARRIAEELGTPLGEHVGFKVRFNDRLSAGASVKLMTDGILLAETQSDPLLKAYDTLIIDEAHERSLNIDFLLGYLHRLLPKRPDLKLIITSATIDAGRFASHFAKDGQPAPVIEVSGRTFPVEVRYRPMDAEPTATDGRRSRAMERDLAQSVVDAVDELALCGQGDILVFLPGEREIRELAEVLRKHHPPHTEILALYARLSAAEQDRVFTRSTRRRIVLSTNVAETSLTVPGIRFVVDSGYARIKRYSYRSKVEQLHVEPISQASANQRAGRCGRVAAGVCIRLYSETDFAERPRFTDPEILRTSLAGVILRMKSLGLGSMEEFPFVERPSNRAITDGYQLLGELNALDAAGELTPLGRELARLPLDPKIGRMILAARDQQALKEMLIIASALSVQDPRDRPVDQQQAADAAHKPLADERSEFVSQLKLWDVSEALWHERKSHRQWRDACRARFLSPMRLREWKDVHDQLLATVTEHGWRLNEAPASYDQLHRALLSGLLGNVGFKSDEDGFYLGTRGIKFSLWPGSTLAKRGGKWVMVAELVETSRLYGRTVARIDPTTIEVVGAHLIKRSWGEPHWSKDKARAVAAERATLYGLTVYAQRMVDYARIDRAQAREVFIRHGLALAMREPVYEPRSAKVAAMLRHNRQVIEQIEQLEHKTRRQDVLVDDELIVALCEQTVPIDIADGHQFETWYERQAQNSPRLLYLDRSQLMRHEAEGVTSEQFPKSLMVGGVAMALSYHFEPGSPRDGVTMTVPLFALNQVNAAQTDWLVPGMIAEKVTLLLKSLPQKLRRHCVPVPDTVTAFLESGERDHDVIDSLIAFLRETRRLDVRRGDFRIETVPAHLWMNYRLMDGNGRTLTTQRNLASLRQEYSQEARGQFQNAFATMLKDVKVRSGAAGGDGDEAASGNGQNPTAQPAGSAPRNSNDRVNTPMDQRADESGSSGDTAGLSGITRWSFGPLQDVMEVRKKGVALIGYPALVDRNDAVELTILDDPAEAKSLHREGLTRLFLLQIRDAVRHAEKAIPAFNESAMQLMPLVAAESLRDQVVRLAARRAFLLEPWPTDEPSFEERVKAGRQRFSLLVQEIGRLLADIAQAFAALSRKLSGTKGATADDVRAWVARLMTPSFLLSTPDDRLAHIPRYLKAATLRLDKARGDPARDALQFRELQPLEQQYLRIAAQRRGAADERLGEFRWLLEELRVALFAQELRTPQPVSVKRLQKLWNSQQY